MVGPSAGFALVGLLEFIKEQKRLGKLDNFKNKDGKIVAVFICPDSPLPYLEEYFEYLDDSYFPKIENENLLINKPDTEEEKRGVSTNNLFEIKAEDAYRLFYPVSKETLWKIVNEEEKEIPIRKDVLIVDVRTAQEFQHFHLPGSIHIELQKLTEHLPKLKKQAEDKKIVFVCKTGNRSGTATQLARTRNIDALNLVGGVTEWSRLNLPRIRPKVCIENHDI